MQIRFPILLLSIVSFYGIARAQSGAPSLELQPSSINVAPWYESIQARVILKNPGKEPLKQPTLTYFTNDGIQVRLDSPRLSSLEAGGTAVWTVWIDNLSKSRTPGEVQFEVSYLLSEKPTGHLQATLKVEASSADAQEKAVEVSIQGTFDGITSKREGSGYLIIKNNLDVPVKISSVTILQPDERSFKPPKNISPFEVTARSTCVQKIVLEAADQVAPGKRVAVFDVRAEWDKGGHHYTRSVTADKEVSVGVFFESELLTALGVPSFLLLPGCLFIFTMQLLFKLGLFSLDRHSKAPDISAKSAEFWIVAVTFSGLFALVYGALTKTDYLVRYGPRDLLIVWLSCIALGIITYTLIAVATSRRRRERVPATTDGPIATLEKMGRKNLGINANEVAFTMNSTKLTAFLIENIEDGQTMVWVAPPILTIWEDNVAAREGLDQVTQLLNARENPSLIANVIRKAKDGKQVSVSWITKDSVPQPYHLKVESITEYKPLRLIVQTSE